MYGSSVAMVEEGVPPVRGAMVGRKSAAPTAAWVSLVMSQLF